MDKMLKNQGHILQLNLLVDAYNKSYFDIYLYKKYFQIFEENEIYKFFYR